MNYAADFNAVDNAFFNFLGLTFDEVTEKRAVARWRASANLHQPAGILNGGAYCTAHETVATVGAIVWFFDRGNVVGVSNTTDFFRSVSEGDLISVAEPVHQGRLQQVWTVETRDLSDRLMSRGQVRLQNLPSATTLDQDGCRGTAS